MEKVRKFIEFYYEKTGKILSFAQAMEILKKLEKRVDK